MKKFWKTFDIIIVVLIIIASILVVFSSFGIGGLQIFTVKTDSMKPAFRVGSMVVVRKQQDYKVGDIITFRVPDSKDTTTHRIFEVNSNESEKVYKVKGDANPSPDSEPVLHSNTVGRVLFSIPLIGYLVAFTKTLPGLVIFIVIPATIIIYEEIGNIRDEIKKHRRKKGKRGERSQRQEARRKN